MHAIHLGPHPPQIKSTYQMYLSSQPQKHCTHGTMNKKKGILPQTCRTTTKGHNTQDGWNLFSWSYGWTPNPLVQNVSDAMLQSMRELRTSMCTVGLSMVNSSSGHPLYYALVTFCGTNNTVLEVSLLTLNQVCVCAFVCVYVCVCVCNNSLLTLLIDIVGAAGPV